MQRNDVDPAGVSDVGERPKSVDHPEAGTRLSAAEIHDNVVGPAEDEMDRTATALLFSSVASGLTIGFSFLLSAFARSVVPAQYADFAGGMFYPIGFVFVIFARSELFTENTLEPVIPLFHKRDMRSLKRVGRLWGLLLAGNLVGAALFAAVLYYSSAVSAPDVRHQLMMVAHNSTGDGFRLTFYRGVGAGWLIALLAWLLASTQESIAHLVLIWLATAPIAWLEFRHSIAGSVEAFYRVFAGDAGIAPMLGAFIVPAVVGNALGGVVMVAIFNYGQVKGERH